MKEINLTLNLLINDEGEVIIIRFKDKNITDLLKSEGNIREILSNLEESNNLKTKDNADIDNKQQLVNTEILEKYRECISKSLSPLESDTLRYFQKGLGKDIVLKAIDIAVMNNGKNLGYIYKILNDWNKRKLKTVKDVEKYLGAWSNRQNSKTNYKKTNFNNYEQREYDYEKLEKELLGLDK